MHENDKKTTPVFLPADGEACMYTKPNFCSSATKLLKLVYTPLNVFVDKCIAKYINSLQYIITIYYTNSSLQHFQGWFFAHEKND